MPYDEPRRGPGYTSSHHAHHCQNSQRTTTTMLVLSKQVFDEKAKLFLLNQPLGRHLLDISVSQNRARRTPVPTEVGDCLAEEHV